MQNGYITQLTNDDISQLDLLALAEAEQGCGQRAVDRDGLTNAIPEAEIHFVDRQLDYGCARSVRTR